VPKGVLVTQVLKETEDHKVLKGLKGQKVLKVLKVT
jgi:hypothetical protein